MCLIGLALGQHPRYPLILAANRDEFYARATFYAHWWPDSNVLAGRDLVGGGTWLGVSRDGRVAALTNFRERQTPNTADVRPSRGALVRTCLTTSTDGALPASLAARGDDYAGFNLLSGHVSGGTARMGFFSNRDDPRARLAPGIYGLSNGVLDAPWPKTCALRDTLAQACTTSDESTMTSNLFDALAQPAQASDQALPDTGVGLELERRLSAAFIHSPGYGTRCSTLIFIRADGMATFAERSFDEDGKAVADKTFVWRIAPPAKKHTRTA